MMTHSRFSCLLLALLVWLSPSLLAADVCSPNSQSDDRNPAQTDTSQATGLVAIDIAYALDGDSLKLANGDELRIIGINTPEKGEFLADQARQIMRQITAATSKTDKRFYIQPGRDNRDSYGRILAHLWVLQDDKWTSPAVELLEQGLAFHVAIHPNLTYISCYSVAEQQARANTRGLWDSWQPVQSTSAKIKTGFTFISGEIVDIIDKGRFGSELVMAGDRVGLWIPARSYQMFGGKSRVLKLHGQKVVARGWVYKRNKNKRLQLAISHPNMLK